MSFFMNLMGKKLLGTVEVRFYGENKSSVEYKTEATDKNQIENDLVQLFALYYSKTLSDLGRGEPADSLITYIQTAIKQVLSELDNNRVSIIGSEAKLQKPRRYYESIFWRTVWEIGSKIYKHTLDSCW
jgi:hypothetical protein